MNTPNTKRASLVAALILSAVPLFGCEVELSVQQAGTRPEVPLTAIGLASKLGCLLDSDCQAGRFCFQQSCTQECSDENPCSGGAHCSGSGRCMASVPDDGSRPALDEELLATLPTQVSDIKVLEAPAQQLEIDPGQPFAELRLTTATDVPGGALLYRVQLEGQQRTTQETRRVEGKREFKLLVPTGKAGGLAGEAEVQRVSLVTALGGFSVMLVPRIQVDGLYAGEIRIRQFGGPGIPLRFGLRVVPSGASFAEATERFIVLPASAQDVFSPISPKGDVEVEWVERPLSFDSEAGVYFARVAHPFAIASTSLFRDSGEVTRALRIEISAVEGKRVHGAVADRWLGLFDARTADGIVMPGQVALAGQMEAVRVSRLPADAAQPSQGEDTVGTPEIAAPVALKACSQATFATLLEELRASFLPVPPVDEPCQGVNSVANFGASESESRAMCALAIAEQALSGPSTAAQVRGFLDDSQPNPGGLPFSEFLEKCAAQQGYCVASPEMRCAEELVAYAYQTQTHELKQAGALLDAYQRVAREGYLGRQLAAFQVDTQTRLEWLRTSVAPAFLASELRAYNEDILARWETQVLDAHFDVLARQLAPEGLEVLARTPTDAEAQAVRKEILLDYTQTWQGAMEALQLAAQRWNALHQNDIKRVQARDAVRRRMFDLYLSAAILAELNRSSGSAGSSAAFGSGFSALMRSLEALSLPFNELVFMRDAEVVVSRSVDPESDSRTLLGDLEELARRAVADAQQSVDLVLAEASRAEIDPIVLTERMRAQIDELRAELIELCGLPLGCEVRDVDVRAECRVSVEAGRCGFISDTRTGDLASFETLAAQENVSEAGRAILSIRQAILDHRVAEEELRANTERAQIEYESAEAFAQKVREWDRNRRKVWSETERLLNEMWNIQEAALRAELRTIGETQQIRERAYVRQAANVSAWSSIRYKGVDADLALMGASTGLKQAGAALTLAGDEVDRIAEVWADGMPKALGLSNDTAAPARLAIGMSAFGVTTGMRAVAFALDASAAGIEVALEEQRARREAELSELSDLAELEALQSENALSALAERLRGFQLQYDWEAGSREALIDALRRNLELDLAYDRDLVELRDRREKVLLRLADTEGLRAKILRVEVTASQRQHEYMQVTQRAQLLSGRYEALRERLDSLDVLMASPSVIFAFANRLARAESRLDRAKQLLYDWLVALEYYAVRPFLDQRLAILLARNPSQLEAIANELLRLERACGGRVNYEVAELSLRDDLLRVGFDVAGELGETQTVVSAAERFRAILRRGNVPVDTQVRYSADERVGDLIGSRDVLAATFDIRLEDFANLPLSCNAKIASLGVQLVGEKLGAHVRPTVSVLYDGTSYLRSCQANIEDVVSVLPPGTTAFGPIAALRTSGRSVSPVAALNAFGSDGSDNRGLEGLPLASTYTVLIDAIASENGNVNWEALDDIRLRFTYAYQDLFPAGQCE